MSTVLYVIGSTGKLGNSICWMAKKKGYTVVPLSRYECDLSEGKSDEWAFVHANSVVINCAWQYGDEWVNFISPAILARMCKQYGAKYVGILGEIDSECEEKERSNDTPTNLIEFNGKHKTYMEQCVFRNNPDALLVDCDFIGWSPLHGDKITSLMKGGVVGCKNREWSGLYSTALAGAILDNLSLSGVQRFGPKNTSDLADCYIKVANRLDGGGRIFLIKPKPFTPKPPTVEVGEKCEDGLDEFMEYLM